MKNIFSILVVLISTSSFAYSWQPTVVCTDIAGIQLQIQTVFGLTGDTLEPLRYGAFTSPLSAIELLTWDAYNNGGQGENDMQIILNESARIKNLPRNLTMTGRDVMSHYGDILNASERLFNANSCRK